MLRPISIVDYDPKWPALFDEIAFTIYEILGSDCLEVHHVGSTSIPGMMAKPILDVIAVIQPESNPIELLEKKGFIFKGDHNLPFKKGFTFKNLSGVLKVNLHVFERDDPEIELNLIFRDYLRIHSEDALQYAQLKKDLLARKDSFIKKENSLFAGYNLGKDAFIRNILRKAGFQRLRFLKVTHNNEWASFHRLYEEQLCKPQSLDYDPVVFCPINQQNEYLALCDGTIVAAIAHLEKTNANLFILKALAVDFPYHDQGYGSVLIEKIQKWLKSKGISLILSVD